MAYSYLEKQLMRHEGYSSKPYYDTVGKLTIGYGRNLEDRGINRYEAAAMLKNDIAVAQRDVDALGLDLIWVSETRRDVLVNMAFNLGRDRLATFRKMIAAIKLGDFDTAADEMLNSKWANQVGQRARELSRIMRYDRR